MNYYLTLFVIFVLSAGAVLADSLSIPINESGHYDFDNHIILHDEVNTPGAVLHVGTDGRIDTDETIFFWDDTNNRLGVGTSSPETALHVEDDTFGLQTLRNTTVDQGAFTQWYNNEGVRMIAGADGNGFSGTQGQAAIATWTEHPIAFFTNQVQRMILTESGNLGIGTTSPKVKLGMQGSIGVSANHLHLTANGDVGIGSNNPTVRLFVEEGVSGNIIEFSDETTICGLDPEPSQPSISCASDRRLKDNIADAPDVLPYLLGIPIRQFTLKGQEEVHVGVIAQELQADYPELVVDDDEYLKVAIPSTWHIIKAIQELWERITGNQQKLAEIEARIEQLEDRLP